MLDPENAALLAAEGVAVGDVIGVCGSSDSDVLRPYYSHAGIDIFCGDNLLLLPFIPSNSIDAIVTDPQYGTASESKVQKRGANMLETFNIAWDGDLPLAWLKEAYRVLKPGGSLIAFTDKLNIAMLWDAAEIAKLRPLNTLYWHKTNPPPQPRQNFCSAVETALFARKPGKVLCWNGGGSTSNIITAPISGGDERTEHPTQKSKAVMAKLIACVTNPGDLVLDPFMGSGTTLRAAKEYGCRAIGMDINPLYCKLAALRVAANHDTIGRGSTTRYAGKKTLWGDMSA